MVLTPAFDFVIIKLQLFNVFLCATGCHALNTCQNCKQDPEKNFPALLVSPSFLQHWLRRGWEPISQLVGEELLRRVGKDSAQLFPDAGRQSAADLGKGKGEFKSSLDY